MNKKICENLINFALEQGSDYAELFFENTKDKRISYIDEAIEKVNTSYISGVGIRLVKDLEVFYSHTSDLSEENIKSLILKLSEGFDKVDYEKVVLKSYKSKKKEFTHNLFTNDDKKLLFDEINEVARNVDKRIIQVENMLLEKETDVIIASSKGVYTKDKREYTRIFVTVIAKESDKLTRSYHNIAFMTGYENFDKAEFLKGVVQASEKSILKLAPTPFKGGVMPVIVGSGFGGVIIHEACGHAMEASCVSRNDSVLKDMLGKKIASDIVNIVDDPTLDEVWGSIEYDDEGFKTKRISLVENGVLKNYMTDLVSGMKLGIESTSSSRRENYMFAPVSRMSNTYLVPGKDKFEDMVKSIDNGFYAKTFSGGQVNPYTGEFNFTVSEGYIIEDGELKGLVCNVSLIGDAIDILNKIDMISNDFEYGYGVCSASSGYVNTTSSQPSIRVSSILVGGNNE